MEDVLSNDCPMSHCGGYIWLTFLAACSHCSTVPTHFDRAGAAGARSGHAQTIARHVVDDADAAGNGHMRIHTDDFAANPAGCDVGWRCFCQTFIEHGNDSTMIIYLVSSQRPPFHCSVSGS